MLLGLMWGPMAVGQERSLARPLPNLGQEENYQKVVDAAKAYANAVTGADSGYEYNAALDYALRGAVLAGTTSRRTGAGGPLDATKSVFVSPLSDMRRSEELQKSIFNDPLWQENWKAILGGPAPASAGASPRIWGGGPVVPGEFPACVAVGTNSGFCCTGTLIGPNVVVTAAHCVAGGCSSRVYFGDNSNVPSTGVVVAVSRAIAHPGYNPGTSADDIAILILASDAPAGTKPAPIALSADVDSARFYRAVGFGVTHTGGFGQKWKVDVAVATPACARPSDSATYGCHSGKELVAGGNGFDTCNGDSGGPYFLIKGTDILLAGATSRATRNSANPCGDGGIAVRVDQYSAWIKATAAMNGGRL